ncbi:unnamed protein product [Closterium sp. Naga37s-1]|nr:unnamed protein product [Closterium sp. Naga37s-1]
MRNDPQYYVLKEDETPCIFGPVQKQRWSYACAKQLIERVIYAEGAENDLKFTIVRPFNWIGPRMDFIPGIDGPKDGVPRVLACFSNQLLRGEPLKLVDGGKSQRTFVYIKDAIRAVMLMIENPERANGHIFNVGNPKNEANVRELATMMTRIYCKVSKQAEPATPTVDVTSSDFYGKGYDDSDRRIPDMTLIQQQLGWEPETSLEELLDANMANRKASLGGHLQPMLKDFHHMCMRVLLLSPHLPFPPPRPILTPTGQHGQQKGVSRGAPTAHAQGLPSHAHARAHSHVPFSLFSTALSHPPHLPHHRQANMANRKASLGGHLQPMLKDFHHMRMRVLIPTYPCPYEERVGAWGVGGKVCVGTWAMGATLRDFHHMRIRVLIPTYPCPYEERVGAWGVGGKVCVWGGLGCEEGKCVPQSVGRKWVCLIPTAVQAKPVVYSVGSDEEYSFEESMFRHYRSQPYTLDPFLSPQAQARMQLLRFLHFHSLGLTGKASLGDYQKWNPNATFRTLPELMQVGRTARASPLLS